jgi:hypothetical protein
VCTAGVCVESAVNIPVTGVTLSEHTTAITVGDTHQLIATIAPGNASNPGVSWSSNNTAVATVNSSGLVTAVGAGSATILVTTTDGNYTDTTVVTVSANSGSSGGGGVNRLQLVINLANQTINQIKQSVANIFRGKINSPVQPTTTPPTDLQPPPPPTTQTQTVTTENQNMIIVIYQKIITAIISLFNSLFGK